MHEARITSLETEEFLQAKYGGDISNVQQLGEGGWSYAYSFTHKENKNVIRWGDVSDNFERDAFAAQFNSIDLPIPQIKEIGEAKSKFFAISPFVTGSFFEDAPASEIERCTASILKMFRAIRSADISDTQGYGFFNKEGKGSHDSWKTFLLDDKNESAGSLTKGWRQILEASEMGMQTYDKLWDKFKSLVDYCPEDKRLVHSDLINRNVLMEEGKITAVLDWGSAFFGDPLYDIAWLVFYEPWYPNFTSAGLISRLVEDFKADPNSNTEDMDERLLCYKLNIGAGSIAYNAFKKNWKNAKEAADYTLKITS